MIRLRPCCARLGGTGLLPCLRRHPSTAAGSSARQCEADQRLLPPRQRTNVATGPSPSGHIHNRVCGSYSRRVSHELASHHPVDQFDRVVGRPDRRNLRLRTRGHPSRAAGKAGSADVTSLTAEADSFDSDPRLFSAVRPVVSPEPPEGPAQARTRSYETTPTTIGSGAQDVPMLRMGKAAGLLWAH